MKTLSLFFLSFTIFGSYLGILLCFGQLVLERKTALNRLLASLFFGLACLQVSVLCITTNKEESFPLLILLYLPVLGTIGPILYGIHKIIQDPNFEETKFGLKGKHWILPGFLWFVYFASFLITKNNIQEGIRFFLTSAGAPDWICLFPLGILVAYLIAILKGSRMLFQRDILRNEWTARVLLYILFATTINHSTAALFLVHKNGIFLQLSSSLMALSLCISYLIGRKYPQYFQNLQSVARESAKKYARSLLQGLDRNVIRENILICLEKEKIFRDENLTLSMLAEELALTPHQLSEFINQELGKNFAALVNDYRIRDACELLINEPERSILDIAYEVGFRSKTSFHRSFLKGIGLPPSEYREQNIK
ncbi:AraC family transcriptional regulator [Leptospira stimsonii]|uniref:AraC family transcriptional regulator n=1 Tax=Leptospira stimsonii TaxID=2202203 RepID=A0ABY2MWV4_9LEPT|nr:helix-turn-helix domain-containing protein [Leptospira stimsonii]TGK23766.1 AraC family transcriptional regulator [Leptospira stimsonii]TGM10526.1 AraC family transcriptional regulator [Leptospira stimsonii]